MKRQISRLSLILLILIAPIACTLTDTSKGVQRMYLPIYASRLVSAVSKILLFTCKKQNPTLERKKTMKPPIKMCKVIGRERYDVKTAILIADDCYWDGNNYERYGTNKFLYRTPKGAYFMVRLTQWQDEVDTLVPITVDEAIHLYAHELSEHHLDYSVAFPEVRIEDA
jgi:hypothetical protein